jgi:hypothetical protein
LEAFDVLVSRDAGANYEPVAGCTGLPGTARACSWTPSAAATWIVRVVGRDASGNAGAGGAAFPVTLP